MKYVVIQGDGMSDLPVELLGGLTPLEKAATPNMDRIAFEGRLGLARTIPSGMPAGTDVGTMSILGYDPKRYHTGRSPIEAASMGIDLADDDVAFRCNLVTLDRSGAEPVMDDFTAGHVTTEDATRIIESLQAELGDEELEFHAGVSYRHCLVWKGGPDSTTTTPPHDITDQLVTAYLPSGDRADRIAEIAAQARAVIESHEVNAERAARGEKPVTDIWLWGQGRRPAVPTLAENFGLSGALITAVDVVGGLGRLAGLTRIDVPGITGFIDTNYVGKGEYALAALEEHDFVFIHVESPDETGHMGDADLKVQAIEDLDEKVIGTILEGISRYGDYRILVLPDHATPVSTKTHTDDPVPFAIYDSTRTSGSGRAYTEKEAAETGDFVEEGHVLLGQFLGATA
jgi:2,3-bisphosphoglycerate-independent phosphoglycerate mutase